LLFDAQETQVAEHLMNRGWAVTQSADDQNEFDTLVLYQKRPQLLHFRPDSESLHCLYWLSQNGHAEAAERVFLTLQNGDWQMALRHHEHTHDHDTDTHDHEN